MRILLDTHVFLWYIAGAEQLSDAIRRQMSHPATEIFVSVVSIWEAILKHRLGKLRVAEAPEVVLPRERTQHGFIDLPLDEKSALQSAAIPMLHRDPFDRMLICQALVHDLVIATADPEIKAYPVRCLAEL